MGHHQATHHRGPHPRLARIVRNQADRNPNYRCPTCGLTKAEGIAQWGDQGQWEAGHKIAGRPANGTGDYHAQHRHCNRSEGATLGNRRRTTGYTWPQGGRGTT